jgi:PAS domain S-box-containing protein
MKFYADQFRRIRKEKHLSMENVALRMGIVRRTLSIWENKKRIPSEAKIRMLANVLNISVEIISDLKPEHPMSDDMFSDTAESWYTLANLTEEKSVKQENELVDKILFQQKQIKQASVIINALMSSMHSILYVKDTNMKYITANKAFLKNVSFMSGNNVLGKADNDFFSINEAKENNKQDHKVLITGKPLIKYEGYIPGSRKKRWGLISKLPVFNAEGKITGIIGSFVDITKRKLAESKRQELEEAISKINDCIWIANYNKSKQNKPEVTYVNDAYEKITGIKCNDFIDNPNIRFKYTDKENQEQFGILENNKNGGKASYQYKIKNIIDNSEHEVREKIYNYKENHFLGIMTDITENVKLNTVNVLLNDSLNSITNAFTIYSLTDYKYIFINNAKSVIFGYPLENFYNDSFFRIKKCIHKDFKKSEMDYFFNHSWPSMREYKCITSEGDVKRIEATVIKRKFNEKDFIISIERDVTNQNL